MLKYPTKVNWKQVYRKHLYHNKTRNQLAIFQLKRRFPLLLYARNWLPAKKVLVRWQFSRVLFNQAHGFRWGKYQILSLILIFVAIYFLILGKVTLAQREILVNGGFEAGSLTGWVTQGDALVVSTSPDIYANSHIQTSMEGQYAAKIGDEIPWGTSGPTASSISQEVIIPPLQEGQDRIVMQFSYAVVANDPPSHPTEEKPLFKVLVIDETVSETLYDTDFVYTSQTSGEWYLGRGVDDNLSQQGFAYLSGDRWVFKPWEVVELDLTERVGHLLKLEFRVRDCNYSAHAAYGYLDTVHIGQPRSMVVPPMVGDPVPAEFIEPSIINQGMSSVEQLRLWPWILCCIPLLLLPLLGLLFRRNRSQPLPALPPMSQPSPPQPRRTSRGETKRRGGGFRPKEENRKKDNGGGGFRLPD